MNKQIIKLALDALELRLIKDRQEAKRNLDEDIIESSNYILEKVREYQKELETDGSIKLILE
jgi:hypothetical protein